MWENYFDLFYCEAPSVAAKGLFEFYLLHLSSCASREGKIK